MTARGLGAFGSNDRVRALRPVPAASTNRLPDGSDGVGFEDQLPVGADEQRHPEAERWLSLQARLDLTDAHRLRRVGGVGERDGQRSERRHERRHQHGVGAGAGQVEERRQDEPEGGSAPVRREVEPVRPTEAPRRAAGDGGEVVEAGQR